MRSRQLGWPKDNREVIALLEQDGLITAEMKDLLWSANGMRNIMVHRYEKVDWSRVKNAAENHLTSLIAIAQTLAQKEEAPPLGAPEEKTETFDHEGGS